MLFRKFSCQVFQNLEDTVWIRPVQPEKEHLQRNDISDLNLNQRHLPPVKKYQIVFRSGNFLFHVQNRYISIKNRQIQAILTTFDIVMAGILLENGDFEHFPDRDNSYLGCENECKLSLTLLIIISNLTRS